MTSNVRNVFVSHIHEDDEGLKKLKSLLSKNGMDIRDSSINSDKPNNATSPDYIKIGILAPQINWAGTFLVYITPETKNSEWVNWEIEYAEKQGKRIVGIWANGDNKCEVPEALDNYADAIVGWQADKIIDAINGGLSGCENQDGTPRSPRPITRYNCG